MHSHVDVKVDRGLATLRPRSLRAGPGLVPALGADFVAAIETAAEDDAVSVLLLLDLHIFCAPGRAGPAPDLFDWATLPVRALGTLRKPVVAAVAGEIRAEALELALACDIRIAGDDARFSVPHLSEGRLPSGGATQRLPRLLPRGIALEMLYTGRVLTAEEALRWGLVNRVVAAADLVESARALAADLAELSAPALALAKEAAQAALDLPLAEGLRLEGDLATLLQSSPDRAEGLRAFFEKRAPRFRDG